ncbi:hypothetical protein [Hufsiella ginkgonis]|uniref:Late embryogenesis abundant protein LEA-2 subgroup domain-containing protein n=1 Tax=Hufsiella ginkgonis TaxID=2695274 RepID=A0A7K1XU76_9SPHI|nr:hypothetical protein [Hufsiella ginkgonis]MXV14544.1 hypothetical protein [Hufsiella ginkgonis]
MKKLAIYSFAVLLLAACGINKQVKQIKALEDCRYTITSVDSMFLVRTDVTQLIKGKSFDLNRMPGLAIALLRKDIPFEARVNLQISNPTANIAAVNQFEYKVLIKDTELATGFVNRKITVDPGGSVNVPVRVNSNIYSFVSNGKTLQEITDFVSGDKEKKGVVTIKFRPTIASGNKLIKYPGWITIDKELSSKILF